MDKAAVVVGHQNNNGRRDVKLAGYRKRPVRFEDLPALEKLGEEQHFDIGLENLQLYYKTCPSGWDLIEDSKGDVVAYENSNQMPNGVTFGFQIIVREDLRGVGLTHLFDKFEDRLHMGNATDYSIARWRFRKWHWRLIGFFGIPKKSAMLEWPPVGSEGLKVVKLTSATQLPQLIQYDKNVVKLDRNFFLTNWCLSEGNSKLARTSVALSPDGKVVGYATLRKTTAYFTLSPLYADSDAIAQALVASLVEQLGSGDFIYFKCLAASRQMVACGSELGLMQTETEMQHYFPQAETYLKSIQWPKVFCVHEFWAA